MIERERVVLDPLAPQFVHLRRIRRPGLLLAVESERLVEIEVRLLLQELNGVLHALAAALLEAAENDERGFDVAPFDGIVELVAIFPNSAMSLA